MTIAIVKKAEKHASGRQAVTLGGDLNAMESHWLAAAGMACQHAGTPYVGLIVCSWLGA
jgi:hypothetical protein